MIDRLNSIYLVATLDGPRDVGYYCARADARVLFGREILAAWPRIARVIAAAKSMRYADGGPSSVLEERLDEALQALEEKP